MIRNQMIIADTGFFLALLDRNDGHHKIAVAKLKQLNEPLVTTIPVITEATHLILTRLGWPSLIRFIESIDNGFVSLFEIPIDHFGSVSKLMRKYRGLPMDFADASLIVLADSLGHGRVLSTDTRDFKAYRWKERKPFENLLV
jgi:predicted nucleic acid-binding protein